MIVQQKALLAEEVFAMTAQRDMGIALTKVPEIEPLETAAVRFAGFPLVRFQQSKRAAEVALVPGVLRQTHVGVVKILVEALAICHRELGVMHRPPPLPQGAGET